MNREECLRLDAEDSLAKWRAEFAVPEGVIYLDGNSLGPQPKQAVEYVSEALKQWQSGLVRSWNSAGWFDAPARLGKKLAAIIGADPSEVIVTDSMSVNLFKLLVAALRIQLNRRTIVTEVGSFPSDLYIAQSVIRFFPDSTIRAVDADKVLEAIGTDTAVVYLSHVDFRTAHMHDIVSINQRAHQCGALVLWNLAHSAGAMPLHLSQTETDMAVGCGYKYLNGGPGAPAFAHVANRHQPMLDQPLSGWFGHQRPFDFLPDYQPADGMRQLLCGTPPILAYAALEASLDQFLTVDLELVRRKSTAMTQLFIDLVEQQSSHHELRLCSPRQSDRRGSHITLSHESGYSVVQAMIAERVIGDFRAPDLMRFGITPLYLRYVDIWDAVATLTRILDDETWRRPEYQQGNTVT